MKNNRKGENNMIRERVDGKRWKRTRTMRLNNEEVKPQAITNLLIVFLKKNLRCRWLAEWSQTSIIGVWIGLPMRDTKRRRGRMFLAASAYHPPSTCQSVGRSIHARLCQEILQFLPAQGFGQNIHQLFVRPNPFDDNLVEVKKLVDGVELPFNMAVIFSSSTIGTDGRNWFVVRKQGWRFNGN